MTATQQYPEFNLPGSVDTAFLRAGFVTPLSDLGVMICSGPDAASFLHRQLTNDVEHLRTDEARLAAYCTAQGRLLASFLMWKSGDQILLQTPREILPGVQKRLQMFVLRDKAKLADASDTLVQIGLGGVAASDALTAWFSSLPDAPYAKTDGEHGSLIRVADAFDAPRYLWICDTQTLSKVWPSLAASLNPAPESAWRLAEIDAGIAYISAATQEKFVAQMVNLELVGGVNFRKGCYPGQEVVARTQYLGKVRRRMLAASINLSDGEVAPATDVYASNDPGQPCGMIVNAERSSSSQIACLVSLRLPVPEGVSVHLGSAQGPMLQFKPLPYPLPEDGERS